MTNNNLKFERQCYKTETLGRHPELVSGSSTEKQLQGAFTLAEVLITLGIIGVVAAVTMPTLVTNYKKKVTVEKLKQAYSMFNQALMKSQADNGDIKNWDYSLSNEDFFNLYIIPYIPLTKLSNPYQVYTLSTQGGGYSNFLFWGWSTKSLYIMDNGFVFAGSEALRDGKKFLTIDINGKNPPNVLGIDAFSFVISGIHNRLETCCANYTREQILNTDASACKRDNLWQYYRGACCSALIMRDNWKISKDYPWGNGGLTPLK